MKINIESSVIEQLKIYSELLNKSSDQIIKEALEEYFSNIQKKIYKDALEKENNLTNLSYEEFWDGVDI